MSTLSESITAGSLVGVNTSFLADLHLPTNITTLSISGGISGSGSNGSGTISSDTIVLTDTADVLPEPSSFVLLIAGMAAASVIAWKRRAAKRNEAPVV
jgi:hypothetical protein